MDDHVKQLIQDFIDLILLQRFFNELLFIQPYVITTNAMQSQKFSCKEQKEHKYHKRLLL